ncbi:hypothetical protein HGRIS_009951 [Hohenbuehelia grisea]|uniref:Uncharacterized protein n=1 Tax=Hohenbuehelia grisea TaxID=104357 RepID=A0ABR3J2U0_9AGAR
MYRRLVKQPPRLVRGCTPAAANIVRKILVKGPMKTQDIWQKVREEYPDVKTEVPPRFDKRGTLSGDKDSDPPYPDHAIRSVKYLKSVVLEHLAKTGEVEKFLRKFEGEELQKHYRDQAAANKLVAKRLKKPLRPGEWLWRLIEEQERF